MDTKDWITILIPAGISILGFVITFFKMRKEFHNSIKQANNEDRKRIYEIVSELLDKAIEERSIVYDQEYRNSLANCKFRVKLYGSKEVVAAYRKYFGYIYNFDREYQQYYSEHDPLRDIVYDEEGYPQSNVSPEDMERFKNALSNYKYENTPTLEEIQEQTNSVYGAMRKNIGTND